MIDRLLDSQNTDRILFLSGGPKSHLAKRSMFCKDMKKRVIVTQPNMESNEKHSPLNGETKLSKNSIPIHAVLQKEEGGIWETSHLLNAKSNQ